MTENQQLWFALSIASVIVGTVLLAQSCRIGKALLALAGCVTIIVGTSGVVTGLVLLASLFRC